MTSEIISSTNKLSKDKIINLYAILLGINYKKKHWTLQHHPVIVPDET